MTLQSVSHTVHTNPNHVAVSFDNNKLSSTDENSSLVFATTDSHSRILLQLNAAAEISTQLYCHAIDIPRGERFGIQGRQKAKLWSLKAIIYGPVALEDTIGDFLSSYGMYLQDPLGCNRRVPYRNPHLFSDEPDEIMTDSFQSPLPDIEIERLDVGLGLLAQLMEDEAPLEETEAPPIVTTDLFPYFTPPQSLEEYADETYRHQKQALTFMLRRERGWNMDPDNRDIWAREMDARGRVGHVAQDFCCKTWLTRCTDTGTTSADFTKMSRRKTSVVVFLPTTWA